MAKKYAVVNTDNMSGTKDASLLLHLRYVAEDAESGEMVETEIENASLVVVGDYEADKDGIPTTREVRVATTPTGSEDLKNIALVANPEVIHDETVYHPLCDYINEAGKVVRGYRFHENDNFAATAEAFDKVPEIGQYAVLGDTTKIKVADSATGTVIGKIVDITRYDFETYYDVQVTF